MKLEKFKNIRLMIGLTLLLMIVSGALFASLATPYLPGKMDISQRLLSPSPEHWLGTDLKGIDVWTSLLYGARMSLGISFLTVLITTTLGGWVGLFSGYFGGWPEQLMMRLIDIFMAFPGMILTLTVAALLPPTYFSLIFTISLTGWIGPARLVRGEVLSLKERDYILAAKALGNPPLRILFRHLCPALFPLLMTQITTSIAAVILVESGLSFLGLGPHGMVPTWGQLLSEGRTVIAESPVLAIAPGMSIFIVILSVNLITDALRDQFDPLRKRRLS